MRKYYAGIGSRKAPDHILEEMRALASIYEEQGYILRSGGAIGADSAFEASVVDSANKEIFRGYDAVPWAFEYVEAYCMPNDRRGFANWKPYIKGLLARNMMQILGADGQTPVDFVVCWAPSLDYSDSSAGGTGYALRCALRNGIPICNLYDENCRLPGI